MTVFVCLRIQVDCIKRFVEKKSSDVGAGFSAWVGSDDVWRNKQLHLLFFQQFQLGVLGDQFVVNDDQGDEAVNDHHEVVVVIVIVDDNIQQQIFQRQRAFQRNVLRRPHRRRPWHRHREGDGTAAAVYVRRDG